MLLHCQVFVHLWEIWGLDQGELVCKGSSTDSARPPANFSLTCLKSSCEQRNVFAELLVMSESILAGYTFKSHPASEIVPLENNYPADLENVFLVMKWCQ